MLRRNPYRRLLCHRSGAYLAAALLLAGCGGGTAPSAIAPVSAFPSASTQQWVQQFGPTPNTTFAPNSNHPLENLIAGLAVDQSGAVIGVGFTLGNFPGVNTFQGPLSQNLVFKFSATGSLEWVREFGTGSGDSLEAVAVDTAGNSFVSGGTLGAFPGFSNPGGLSQAIVAKFDPNGKMLWLQQIPLAGVSDLSSIAVDGNGDVLAGGTTRRASDPPGESASVVKLSGATGDQIWYQQYGTSGSSDVLEAVAVDSARNAFVSVNTSGPFPGTSNQNLSDMYVLKLNGASGNQIWMQQFTGKSGELLPYLPSLAVDSSGDVVAGGISSPSGIGFIGMPGEQNLLFKLNGVTGSTVWSKTFGTGKGDAIFGVSVDPSGNILATGATSGSYETQYSYPNNIVFLLKFDANGNNIWAQELAGGQIFNTGVPSGPTVATDASGNAYISSLTQGAFPGFTNPTKTTQMVLAKFGP